MGWQHGYMKKVIISSFWKRIWYGYTMYVFSVTSNSPLSSSYPSLYPYPSPSPSLSPPSSSPSPNLSSSLSCSPSLFSSSPSTCSCLFSCCAKSVCFMRWNFLVTHFLFPQTSFECWPFLRLCPHLRIVRRVFGYLGFDFGLLDCYHSHCFEDDSHCRYNSDPRQFQSFYSEA